MNKVTEAQIEIGEAFNNCPGRKEIERHMKEGDLADSAQVVDYGGYWINDEATLVLAISANSMSSMGLQVGKLVHDTQPDEFDYKFDNATKQYVCRFWWD